jgi:hypothetical protein
MKRIIRVNQGDHEVMHRRMDALLCKVLIDLGYEQGIIMFNNETKWYS